MSRIRGRPLHLAFEPLETRNLLAAGVTARLARGLLTVIGTEAADVITIDVQHTTGRRGRSGPSFVVVEGVKRFRANQVRQIRVDSGAGDDVIRVDVPGLSRITILCGSGNDQITCDQPNAQIVVGGGHDVINGVTAPEDKVPPPGAPLSLVPPSGNSTPSETMTGFEQLVFDLTNQQRVSLGLTALNVNAKLVKAGHIQANNMARLETMEHTLPTTETPTFTDRASKVGYTYAQLGENIAMGYPDAAAVVTGWMDSPHHRENILDPHFTEMGIGIAFTSAGVPYYSQEFGTPAGTTGGVARA